jgi:hypothetical protein
MQALQSDHVCLRVEAMRQEAKADVAALPSEVSQFKKAVDAESAQQPHSRAQPPPSPAKVAISPQAPQAAVPPQEARPQAPPAAPKLDLWVVHSPKRSQKMPQAEAVENTLCFTIFLQTRPLI